MPDVDRELKVGDACAVVESVKAASDVYAPVAGKVVAVNEKLADAPETLNDDPYGEGWLFRLEGDTAQAEQLLDADAYSAEAG